VKITPNIIDQFIVHSIVIITQNGDECDIFTQHLLQIKTQPASSSVV